MRFDTYRATRKRRQKLPQLVLLTLTSYLIPTNHKRFWVIFLSFKSQPSWLLITLPIFVCGALIGSARRHEPMGGRVTYTFNMWLCQHSPAGAAAPCMLFWPKLSWKTTFLRILTLFLSGTILPIPHHVNRYVYRHYNYRDASIFRLIVTPLLTYLL